jgi:hypothetical protein
MTRRELALVTNMQPELRVSQPGKKSLIVSGFGAPSVPGGRSPNGVYSRWADADVRENYRREDDCRYVIQFDVGREIWLLVVPEIGVSHESAGDSPLTAAGAWQAAVQDAGATGTVTGEYP